MFRGIAAVLAAATFAVPALAQSVVDGTGSKLSPAELQQMFKLAAERLPDAGAAQYRGLFRAQTQTVIYCGQVQSGVTGGRFVPFAANLGAGVLWLALPGYSRELREEHLMRVVGFGCARPG